MSRILSTISLCALAVSAAFAQSSRGTVTGIVTDAQAGVVAGATVEITGVQTGVKRETKTNSAGLYRFDAVDLGDFTLTVAMQGFRTSTLRGVSVQGGQITSVDVRLEVGETRAVVEVTAEAESVLQTEAPLRGGNLGSTSISQLPVATRDPAQLGLTLPGVTSNRFGFGQNTYVVNGGRGRSNNFMVDGADNNDVSVAGQMSQVLIPDAVAEVNVQTSNYDAEYGRAGGAVVNTITKAGTNDVHGSLAYLLDVTNDDAISNTQSLSQDIQRRGKPLPGTEQWYGGTVGGPVKRNKTFFFGAYQEQRRHSQNTNNLVVPTAAGRATLNSLFPKGSNARVDLYNQITGGVSATSQPFNVPMGGGRPDVQFGTAIVPYAYTYLDRQFMIRADHQISSRDQLSLRVLRDNQSSPQGGAADFFPGFSTSLKAPSHNIVLTETHVFSPTLTNELRLPYNRADLDYALDTENALGRTMPLYTIGGGVSAIGVQTNLPQGRTANNYGLQDTLSWVRGTHSIRFGVTATQQRTRQFAPIRERGQITYGTSTGYSNFANFVDDFGGSSGAVARDFGSPAYYPNYTRQAYFVQDRWRATKNLTLTAGLRYEYFGTPMNTLRKPAFSGLFNIDPVTMDGPYSQANKVEPDKNNFAPTVGLAYSPSVKDGWLARIVGDKKMVIRAGYQIGYDSYFNNITSNAATATPNVIATSVTSTPTTSSPRGTENWSLGLPRSARAPSPADSQTLMLRTLVNPYYQRWSFGVQRELPHSLLLDISYVGSKGTRLFANEDFNPLVPASMQILPNTTVAIPASARTGRLDALQGGRLTRTNGGDSNYNSLQVGVDRRMAKGLMVKFSYTFSKNIDNASEVFGVTNTNSPQNTALPSIYGGLSIDRSVSFFDRTHRAVFSYIYELPMFKKQSHLVGRVLGGWKLTGTTTFETGVPLNIYNGPDADGIGSNFDRPNYNPNGTPGVRAVPSSTSSTGYVNPDAGNTPIDPKTAMYIGLPGFTGTTPAPTGNLGRNVLRVPGLNNFDTSFAKQVKISERFSTEFRAEFYNLWNHPQYGTQSVSPFAAPIGAIAANVGTSPAGRFLQPQYMDGGARIVRYQLRLTF